MKNKYLVLISLLAINLQIILAQIPNGYYNTAIGTGVTLKTALYNIIKGHTDMGYGGLYACYINTDNLPGNKVFDMYSVKPDSTANYWYTNSSNSSDQCGSYNGEGDCYNREHTFCDSWLGEASPQRSDLFHLVPTDGYVNNRRGSYPHGKVSTATWTSTNGSKLGSSLSSTGYTGTVFEPIDIYKGDFARMYFYVATRYENLIAGWVNNGSANTILAGNSFPAYKTWFLNLMISWHQLDTVSQKEINRNNAIYSYQHNRNPFIDHPEYVTMIWGTPVLTNTINVNTIGGDTTISGIGNTLQMTANILPSNATNQNVIWSVNNSNATISQTGLLTSVAIGSVIVKATATDGSGVFGTKQIYLTMDTSTTIAVSSIYVDAIGGATTINGLGKTLQMTANILPTNATNQNLFWSVNNTNASINQTGLLSTFATGSVIIKATATDGSSIFGTKEITITNDNSIYNYEYDNEITLNPNPAQDFINIESKNQFINSITIYDISGKIIFYEQLDTKIKTIDINQFSKGTYFIKLNTKNNIIIKKFIK